MSALANFYHYLNYELAEKKTSEWFLIGSYVPITVITIIYLVFIKIIGPKWMDKREAFTLDKILPPYNLFHICINLWFLHKVWYTGFHDGTLKFKCQPFSKDPVLIDKYITVAWWELLIKVIDLTDTVFFILRKKYNQASFLHVYHHTSMVWLTFIAVKYNFSGGMTGVACLLNCGVHVVMYLYYLLASFGPKVQKILNPVKPLLTTIQMIQFTLILLHYSQLLFPWCYDERLIVFAYIFVPNVLIYFYLFYDFYKQAYKSKANVKMSKSKSH